jgi:modulator of FtsH protease HflK
MSSENRNADPQQEQPDWKRICEQYWQKLSQRSLEYYEQHQHQFSTRNLIAGGAALIVAAWAGCGFYQVDRGYRGVETLIGAYSSTTSQGNHWHMPWPLGQVTLVNVGTPRVVELGLRAAKQNFNIPETLSISRDHGLINAGWLVQYQVDDARNFLFNVANPEQTIKQLTDSLGREEIARYTLADLTREGGATAAGAVKLQLQKLLDQQHAGIQIIGVRLAEIMPPDLARSAFEDAKRAHDEHQHLKHEAEVYANEQITKARNESQRLTREATSYAAEKVAKTENETARFEQLLTEYQKSPAIVRKQLYLDAQEHILAATRKVIVTTDQLPGMYFVAPTLSNVALQAADPNHAASIVDNSAHAHKAVRGELRPSRSKP